MKRLVLSVVATVTVGLLGWVTPVQASPITYTETATGNGVLNGVRFIDKLVTITFTGDSDSVYGGSGEFAGLFLNTGSATVNVAGQTDTFTGDLLLALAPFGVPELGDRALVVIIDFTTSGIGILGTLTNDLIPYDLRRSFGPVSGIGVASTPDETGGEAIFGTGRGNFWWTALPETSTFTATGSPKPVPEPASILLLGTGVVTLVGRRFRQRT